MPSPEPAEWADRDMSGGDGADRIQRSWVPPIWPVPDDGPPGRVWIADDFGDPATQHDGLFELDNGEPVEVVTYTGPGLRAHWERSVQDGKLEYSPTLLFRSMRAAVAWAQTCTPNVVIALHKTEPSGTYGMGKSERRLQEVPVNLAQEWDLRYGSPK